MDKEKDIFLSEILFLLCCLGPVTIHRAVRTLRSSGFKIEGTMVKQKESCHCRKFSLLWSLAHFPSGDTLLQD